MPFYRSTLQTSGGGGGSSESPYINFVTSGELPPLYSYITVDGEYLENHPETVEAMSEIVVGNRIKEVSFASYSGWYNLNCPINLYNASQLNSFRIQQCSDFNSVITFPNMLACEEYEISFGGLLYSCDNYNSPLTIRIHDANTDPDHTIFVNLTYAFCNCNNFNSRVLFDFNRPYKNINSEDAQEYTIQYNITNMFEGSVNFNQPMIFPSGIYDMSTVFQNCYNFNQPVLIDLYGIDNQNPGWSCRRLFKNSQNMCSDIIFYNSTYMVDCDHVFDNLVNNSRNSSINIYIQNSTKFLNNYLVPGVNQINWTTSPSPTNASCNVYTNATLGITISEDIDYGLSQFNNYYYNFYGEYPVIPVV